MGKSSYGWFAYSRLGSSSELTAAGDEQDQPGPELRDVRRLWRRAVRHTVQVARADEQPSLSRSIREFLDGVPAVPVIGDHWPSYDEVNVQRAFDVWLAQPGRGHETLGVIGFQHMDFGLADLVQGQEMHLRLGAASTHNLHAIAQACSIARVLEPAMVVIEDVDLVAMDRHMGHDAQPMLFELLNQMDGLADEADVTFVLTTNRADLLEGALAARPGRIDQAVHLDLPDAAARRALIDLYRRDLGWSVDAATLDDTVARSEGTTASFAKELLRRAALVALERRPDQDLPTVTGPDLRAALDELLDSSNRMTRRALGAEPADEHEPGPAMGHPGPGRYSDFGGRPAPGVYHDPV